MEKILDIDTVALDDEASCIRAIDQTLLPGEIKVIEIREEEEMYDAIKRLVVRGAPAIGVFAAMGIYLLSKTMPQDSYEAFLKEYERASAHLNSSRPTAVNLSWALKRMQRIVEANAGKAVPEIVDALHQEAVTIRNEDVAVCRGIGENGLTLLHDGDGILTHCNAGQLATVRYGTATAPMYLAHEKGMDIHVYCDETRPLLQGARLTAFELSSAGIDTTLQCDNMSASLMKAGKINIIFTGCDRVAANGDTANKIGTSLVAAAAHLYNVPMYICAPTSTIDMDTPTGDAIPIEERNPDEVTEMWYERRMAPENIHVYNPAFDVTDHELIAGIITEKGIAYPPYSKSLAEIMKK